MTEDTQGEIIMDKEHMCLINQLQFQITSQYSVKWSQQLCLTKQTTLTFFQEIDTKLSDSNNYKKYKVGQYGPKLHTYHINK